MANTTFFLDYQGTHYEVIDDIDRVRDDVDKAVSKGGGIVTIATTGDYEAEAPKQIQVNSASDVTITEP